MLPYPYLNVDAKQEEASRPPSGALRWLGWLSLAIVLAAARMEAQPLGIGLESYPYPYPVQFLPLQIEGQDLRMGYMDVAPTGAVNGRAALLMHGKNFGGYYWENVIRALSSAGYRVIVPDQIGWGRSSKPDIRYSFHLLAANTAQLLDKLGIARVAVVGHSTGGMLATRFALLFPDRVTHLVLEGPLGMEDYRVLPRWSDEELYQQELKNTDPEKIRAVFVRYFANPKPEVYGPLADVPIRVTASGEYPRWAKASALAYQMIYEQPVRYEYGLLRPPTLLIVGDKDRTVPLSSKASPELRDRMGRFVELAQKAVKDIPRGTAVIVPECGHIPHIEKPQVFLKALLEHLGQGTN